MVYGLRKLRSSSEAEGYRQGASKEYERRPSTSSTSSTQDGSPVYRLSVGKSKLTLGVFQCSTRLDCMLTVLAIVLNIGSGALIPFFVSLFGNMINSISGHQTKDTSYYVSILLRLGVINFVVSTVGAGLMEVLAERQIKALHVGFLSSMMRQEIAWFDRYDPGTLSSTLIWHITKIRRALGTKLADLANCLGLLLGGFIVAISRGWRLALILTAAIPFVAAAGFVLMKLVTADEAKVSKQFAQAGSTAEEAFTAIRLITAFGLQKRTIAKFNENLEDSYALGKSHVGRSALGLGSISAIFCLTYALGFWYGGKLVADDLETYGSACFGGQVDCFTGGQTFGVFFAMLIAAVSLGRAVPSVTALLHATSSMRVMQGLIHRQSKIDSSDTGGLIPDAPLRGSIEFQDVAFAYPSRQTKPVLSRLNFTINAGETVAIVGASGSGKSAIMQLLERFYDANHGKILIDGRDIKDYNMRWLRQQMAIVNQESLLFATTIEENIAAGTQSCTFNDIEAAAKSANAHGFIMNFENGYQTYVGAGGSQLSGGQKQRIAIARAILRDPSIFILDEATSALDYVSEMIVQDTLDKIIMQQKRTTLVVAHRLSTVHKADKIMILDNKSGDGATIVEAGTHEELMRDPHGLYAALQALQELPHNRKTPIREIARLAHNFAGDMPARDLSVSRLRSRFGTPEVPPASSMKYLCQTTFEDITSKSYKRSCRFQQIMQIGLQYKHPLIWGLIGATLRGVFLPSVAVILSKFVHAFYAPDPHTIRGESAKWSLTFALISILSMFAAVAQKVGFGLLGERVLQTLRRKTFEELVYRDIAYYDDPTHTSGYLSQILCEDPVTCKSWATDNSSLCIENGVCIIVSLILCFTASARLTGVYIGCFTVLVLIVGIKLAVHHNLRIRRKKKRTQKLDTLQVPGFDSPEHLLNEVLVNLRTVLAYTLEPRMDATYQDLVAVKFQEGCRQGLVRGLVWGAIQGLPFYIQAVCFAYGTRLVVERGEAPEMIIRTGVAMMLTMASAGHNWIFTTKRSKTQQAASRIFQILETGPSIDARSQDGCSMPDVIEQGISFQHVEFEYPQRPGARIYRDLDLHLKKGEVTAVVGASGCGKSTLAQLLARFYSPSRGSIRIDQLNTRDINLEDLRRNIGWVVQEPMLLNDTIAANIAMGRDGGNGVSKEEIEAAARIANATEFIDSFPEGFDTMVGRIGCRLSGGQRQRIAIARAVIRNPKILILDEATSALDAENERVVHDALDKLPNNQERVIVLIAHRLSTMRRADTIAVLAGDDEFAGSAILERGSHDLLMKVPNGIYRGLVDLSSSNK